jgi:GntR family transcriptional regulator/MocR family aminotransferase
VLPADLTERFAAARSIITRHLPVLEQAILCDFITGGHFGRHLRRMRELYAERLGVLIDGTRDQLAGLLELSPIEAGLETVGWLAPGIPAAEAAEAAAERNVEVFPLRDVAFGGRRRDGLLLGFAAVPPRELRRGITELAHVLTRLARAR